MKTKKILLALLLIISCAFYNCTYSNIETLGSQYKLGSGKSAGGDVKSTRKFIVGKGTKFLIIFKNDTTSDNWVDYIFEWYENGINRSC